MSIRKLQRSFAKEIARNVHKDVELMIDKLFAAKDINGLETLIEQNKNKWPSDTLKYAKNMLEDLSYAMDRYRKYEQAGYSPEEIRKLVYSKEQLVKQQRKTKDPAKIKDLDEKIATIKQHLDKAQAEDKMPTT